MSSEVGSVPEQGMHHRQLAGQRDTRLSGTGTSYDRQRPTPQIGAFHRSRQDDVGRPRRRGAHAPIADLRDATARGLFFFPAHHVVDLSDACLEFAMVHRAFANAIAYYADLNQEMSLPSYSSSQLIK